MSNQNLHMDEQLLSKFLAGEATEQERDVILDWVNADEQNADEFARYSVVWSTTNVAYPIDVDAAWGIVAPRLKPKRRALWLVTAAAAVIVVMLLLFKPEATELLPYTPEMTLMSSTKSEKASLPDSSRVVLAEHSSLEYYYDTVQHTRIARLDGAAFFDVARDTSQRFVVETAFGGVEVLGTQFNVAVLDNQDVLVDVMSGKVKVFLPQSQDTLFLILMDNESAIISMKGLSITPVEQEPSVFYHINQLMTFKNTELKSLFEQLEKSYELEIVLDSAVDVNDKFSSSFKGSSIDDILLVISQTFDLSVEKIEKGYLIKKNEN